jgi:FtsZ-binding cell division protein ZapB
MKGSSLQKEIETLKEERPKGAEEISTLEEEKKELIQKNLKLKKRINNKNKKLKN